MSDDHSGHRPFGLVVLAGIYLFALLMAVSSYGDPFPFFGTLYQGKGAERLALGDTLICLYLLLGVMKRQRATVWLLLGYNFLDIANGLVNLALLPRDAFAELSGTPVSEADLLSDTTLAVVILLLLNFYIFANRRHFTNRSPYLF